MVRVLSDGDVASVLDLEELLPVVADAFEKQRAGEVERPERPHYPIGTGLDPDAPDDPAGTGLCMPAYVHGADYAATKLATVVEDNPERGLPTVTAQIEVIDAETGRSVGYLAGNRVTSARTGCIGGLAARELAVDGPLEVAVIGAGTQARWQIRAIAAAAGVDRFESIRVFSPSDSRIDCARDLESELGVAATPVESPREAVTDADVVVTATTSTEPVFPGEALADGALVVAVGAYTPEMRELDDETIARAARVFADVPDEARETGDLRGHEDLEVRPFGDVVAGADGRESPAEIVVLESVGTAVLDAATAEFVFDRAVERGLGTTVSLYERV
ncbi:Ornithine cyclodeaminase [Haloterrigena turkmenica DSM 5511]|uniref:Ornithine cyclodeaminase n=1 Tax=Haloterrigena turkmenica (strain ATCC 51198 / DSM 5511 / JCM 9101 / NCIMB 13204 / VKM B-1734 / 4k) TaxID=543526 RepID=D2RQU1_HALTV|nr:ornithine cyclodeaminase family protein [Haloterrigena turkmenica]ADB60422.1 Ornithine cyclodeaminase [Haloterrigena turkmenica DSM 5511]